MEQAERDAVNHMTALQGEVPHRVGEMNVRRLSIETLGVLQLVGSPFAAVFSAALRGQPAAMPEVGAADIAVMAWVHAADAEEVLATALECSPGANAPAMAAALRFARGAGVPSALQVMRCVMSDLDALEASNFDMAAPELPGGAKKNTASNADCR